ncbi:putative signal recognition particle, SRP54 subunit, GTPase domain-containing protein [Helianthus debilis subsp. tardiflorus]
MRILLAAGDTFRAAVSDQLEIWAERTGCEIVSAEKEKAKASAVLSQAIKKGKEHGFDIVLCDTSGRKTLCWSTKLPSLQKSAHFGFPFSSRNCSFHQPIHR